ncbi:MAG: NADPH:quinone reductase [Chloroflexi bacterium]|nr:MAG: NADPH:quinone reductase [Chloroflexota bacterium]
MRAAWYEHRGTPRESLVIGEMPDPQPGEGEVRIALRVSGVNPGDVKKRSGWQGSPMPCPRVIPHSDGAGTIDMVGPGVTPNRKGQRVWCYGAQSYRPFGTAAEYVVVPDQLAVALPSAAAVDATEFEEQASCLGIAGITGYRAVFADGGVSGLSVLVHGAAGGVGSIATQMARRDGATVIAVVMDEDQRDRATRLGAHHAFLNGQPELAERIRDVAPDGVHRIAEVDFASHIDLDAEILAVGGVVCSYYSSEDRPAIPYWKFGFKDVALRLLGSDDFNPVVKADAARALTEALVDGSLRSHIAARLPLESIVDAHELVETGAGGRVVLTI